MFGRDSFRFRPFTWFLAAVLTILVGVLAIGCFWFASPSYHGPVSDHFDGKQFFNLSPTPHRHRSGFLRWIWTRMPGLWLPLRDEPPGPPPPQRVEGSDLRVTFVNHSTMLIQTAGLNILTDPVWSMRIGPVPWAGPKRHIMPGIRFESLPPIDVVLVSHNHYDHMDLPTLVRLEERFRPAFFAGLGNRKILKDAGLGIVHEMDWWDSSPIQNGVTITFVPSQHFSSRSQCDRDRTLWGGFVISTPGGPIYFASDTGMGPQFEEIKRRFGAPRLAMLPIGAYLPRWFMAPMHLSPEEALDVHETLGAGTSVPTHYGTFRLGDDGQFEAVETLARAIVDRKQSNFLILKPGEGRDIK
jgi:L-ascorbate metabolism protein UlaG (beta-lactamase superfamily)